MLPNILALILFAFLGKRINPISAWTHPLPVALYHAGYGLVEFFCVIIQSTAGSYIISQTIGIDYRISTLLFIGVSLLIAANGGLHSSVISNIWQHIALIVISIILVFLAPGDSGTIHIGTFSVKDTLIFTLILFSGPIMTNQHWQRADKKGYFWSAFFFSIPLCCMGLIGLRSRMTGSYVSLSFDKKIYQLLFLLLIMSGLSSTLQSSLTSFMCLLGGKETLRNARIKMIMLCVSALVIIFGNFQIMPLWKTMGSFRVVLAIGVVFRMYVFTQRKSTV